MFFTFDDFSAGSNNRIDWNSIINQGFALGSQALNSFGGAHTGTQFAQGPQGIFNIAQSGVPQQGYGGYGGMTPEQQAWLVSQQNRGGLGFDDAAGSIMSFITRNPLLVGAGVLGVYLLFREPPKRR